MSPARITYNFSPAKYSDMQLYTEAINIIKCMSDNQQFSQPTPQLSVINEIATAYISTLNNTQHQDKEASSRKKTARAALEHALHQLAEYVQSTAKGDETLILSTGFKTRKQNRSIAPLDKITGLKLSPGFGSGSLIVRWDKMERARFYELAYTDAPASEESIWTRLSITRTKIEIKGLTSGKPYSFKVAAAGSDSFRNWSETINSFVL